jgi:hypothetical protein
MKRKGPGILYMECKKRKKEKEKFSGCERVHGMEKERLSEKGRVDGNEQEVVSASGRK